MKLGRISALAALVAALALAACGGGASSTNVADAAAGDESSGDTCGAQDDGGYGYLACFSPNGQTLASLKVCLSDSDCTMDDHVTDCCGSQLVVGVSLKQNFAFRTCEDAWVQHFPASCSCTSNTLKTEDGKFVRPPQDPDSGVFVLSQVHCVNAINGGCGSSVLRECMSYLP
jgi:hypothetical protein